MNDIDAIFDDLAEEYCYQVSLDGKETVALPSMVHFDGGGMSQLHLVRRRDDSHKSVVLKTLRPEFHFPGDLTAPSMMRFKAEQRVTAALSRKLAPFIPKVWGTYENCDRLALRTGLAYVGPAQMGPGILMEHIQGYDLTDLPTGVFLPADEHGLTEMSALTVLYFLTLAVRGIHKAGFVHRDIKPCNVMLSESSGCGLKLVDFGLATETECDDITPNGVSIGTPGYISPASYHAPRPGRAATESNDLFGVGATIYKAHLYPPYWSRNRDPVPYPDFLKTLKKGQGGPHVPDARKGSALVPIVQKLMAYLDTDRYGSADELLKDVQQKLAEVMEKNEKAPHQRVATSSVISRQGDTARSRAPAVVTDQQKSYSGRTFLERMAGFARSIIPQ